MDLAAIDINNLLSGLVGAVIGAVIGGAISLLLARQASNETAKRDLAAKRERQRAGALRASTKAQQIFTELIATQTLINESIKKADDAGHADGHLWTKVIAPVGGFRPIAIDTDDLVLFVEAEEFDLVNELLQMSMNHETVCEAAKTYAALRSDLKNHMPAHSVQDQVLGAFLSEEDLKRLRPRFLELDTLITDMVARLPQYIEQTKSVASRVGPAARKFLKDPRFPRLIFPAVP
jgi:gas vesicle protein